MVTARAPAISVLMAVRNGAVFLDRALASLAGQEFKNFEIVLIDNGSHDGTGAIISKWVDAEPRLRAYRLERPGLARSLTYAASMARALYLARLDSDDIALPSRLGAQYDIMQNRPALGLLGTFVELMDGDGRGIGERRLPVDDAELKRVLYSANPFVHSTVIMRRDAYDRAGGYREGLRLCEDFDLWCRMAEVTEIANLDRPLVRYRIHGAGMSFRQATRVALVDTCVIAARLARARGEPEPFDRGMPKLRGALSLLDTPRAVFQYRVLKVTTNAARLALEFGERDQSRNLRRRAYRLLITLPLSKATWRGAMHVAASYFRPNSRRRRQTLYAKMFEHLPLLPWRKKN